MIIDNGLRILPRIIGYKLAMWGLIKSPQPLFLNFSITNKCQSQCTMCNIWKLYQEFPEKEKTELNIQEIEKVFKTMDPIFQLSICGGEPFLRDDIDEICRLASKYVKPKIIHMPTNCLAPDKIERLTKSILQKIPKNVHLTIKMSLDGIGKKHDEIRGVKGNFDKVVQVHDILVNLRKQYPNLYVDAGVTVSMKNLDDLKEITEYVEKNFKLDNFLHEIADTRAELFNVDVADEKLKFGNVMKDLKVTPTGDDYRKVVNILLEDVKKKFNSRRKLSKLIQSFRIVYYKRAAKVMTKKRRYVDCYAGISNAHLNPWGGLWLCNVQAFKKEMGNVRDFNYNYTKLWNSVQANKMRRFVKSNQCYCPLVGQAFLDTIMNPKEVSKVLYYYLFGVK